MKMVVVVVRVSEICAAVSRQIRRRRYNASPCTCELSVLTNPFLPGSQLTLIVQWISLFVGREAAEGSFQIVQAALSERRVLEQVVDGVT